MRIPYIAMAAIVVVVLGIKSDMIQNPVFAFIMIAVSLVSIVDLVYCYIDLFRRAFASRKNGSR